VAEAHRSAVSEPSRPPILQGDRLYLRGVELADATDRYVAWMNDPEITKYMESRFSRYGHDDLRAYIAAMRAKPDTLFLAIVLKNRDRHIGNLKLGPVHPAHRTAEVALMIGEKDCWGRGYASEAIRIVSEYGFEQLGVRKMTAGCYARTIGSRKAFEHAGYHVEGVRRVQYFYNGVFEDGLLMAQFNPRRATTG
jgi:RimJ/RimL family protein N-acetyltransferase